MEDDLKYLKIEDNLNFWKWKMTSFLKMEDNLNIMKWKKTSIFLKMEDDLNFFENGRRPQFCWKWKISLFFKC
jgi:hypothetical protein